MAAIARTSDAVGLGRRAASRGIDLLLYGGWFAVVEIAFGTSLISASTSGILAGCLYLIDHLGAASRWGCSLSQWILGYRVVRSDGRAPSLGQHCGRLLVSWTFAAPVLVVTALLRADRAALHDLLTRTRVRRASRPLAPWRIRVGIVAGALAMSSLYAVVALERLLQEVKLVSFERRLMERHELPIEPRQPEVPPLTRPALLGELALLDAADASRPIAICATGEARAPYRLSVAKETFDVFYTQRDERIFRYLAAPDGDPAGWPEMLDALFALDPFLPDTQALAAEATSTDARELSIWSPIANLAHLTAKVWWIVSTPGESMRRRYEVQMATVSGADSFGVLQLLRRDGLAYLSFAVTRGGKATRLELSAPQLTPTRWELVREVFSSIQVGPMQGGAVAPPCGAEIRAARASSAGSDPSFRDP